MTHGEHDHVREAVGFDKCAVAQASRVLTHLLKERPQLGHGEARGLHLLVRDHDMAHIQRCLVATILNNLQLGEQFNGLHLSLEVVNEHLLASDGVSDEVDDLLRDVVLLGHSVNDPIVEAVVHLARVHVDLLQHDQGPAVDLSQAVRQHVLLVTQNHALLVAEDRQHGRVLVHKLIHLGQEVGEHLLEGRARALLVIERLHASLEKLLGSDLGVKFNWWLLLHHNLVDRRYLFDFNFDEAGHVAHDLTHLLVRPAALGHVRDALERLLLALLGDVPEAVGKPLKTAVELVFGLIVLAKVRVLARELVEALDEFSDLVLLGARPLEELNELPLAVVQVIRHGQALTLDV